jgi:SAM-dependent methyltransferase
VYRRRVPANELHRDRDRAESFGSVAEHYERHRPAFPAALLDELAALAPAQVLDIGSGTGKVARGLAARGLSVLGVEIDPRMAAVARELGARIEVAAFEPWDDAGRRFDLVTCGDAWHWIDPTTGPAKVAQVLRPGGVFVWFWNVQVLDPAVMDALAVVYREHAPEIYVYGQAPPLEAAGPFPLAGPFSAPERKVYEWERRVDGAEWTAFVGTISDHQRLPPERLARLRAAIGAALAQHDEPLHIRGATRAHFYRRTH